MSKTESTNPNAVPNAVIVSRISIERCQNHLAHLHALMHLCEPDHLGHDSFVAESVLRVMEIMESDLVHSAKALSHFD